ncbi:MAG: alpha/beta hydrolase [Kangiellaceae bacterium]|nr:alpha/beta hydrolase [Kangiellaceae bacterium]
MLQLDYLSPTKYHILSDHRILCYQEFGDTKGMPVFYSHTTSGSKAEGQFFHKAAKHFGLRLICMDRPGIGGSSYLPKRTLLDYPKDVVELADELRFDNFGVMGWSGGGAYALATSCAIPERLLFCSIIAGHTNFQKIDRPTEHIHSSVEKLIARNHQKHPVLLRIYLDLLSITIKTLPKLYLRSYQTNPSHSDRSIMKNEKVRTILFRTQQEAFKEGSKGPTKDISIQYSDWGFALEEIKIEVDIFHGENDQVVPISFSQNNQQSIPNCHLNVLANQGHLFPCVDNHSIIKLAADKSMTKRCSIRSH